jgi:hypothetical protein
MEIQQVPETVERHANLLSLTEKLKLYEYIMHHIDEFYLSGRLKPIALIFPSYDEHLRNNEHSIQFSSAIYLLLPNPGRGKRPALPQKSARPPLGPTEPPIQWVPAFFPVHNAPGREVHNSPHLVSRLRLNRNNLYSPFMPS